MTPSSAGTETHQQMAVEDFERLARTAPETVTLEFIQGKLEVKPVPDGDHDEIVMWLQAMCMQYRPELGLYGERGLKIETYRNGRAKPDGVLAPRGHFAGHGEWSDPDGVLMTVEVTSHDHDTDRRDRHEKRDGYAAAGIPVHFLINRDEQTLVVYSTPEKGKYAQRTTHPYGATVDLPDPVLVTLDTGKLKDYAH